MDWFHSKWTARKTNTAFLLLLLAGFVRRLLCPLFFFLIWWKLLSTFFLRFRSLASVVHKFGEGSQVRAGKRAISRGPCHLSATGSDRPSKGQDTLNSLRQVEQSWVLLPVMPHKSHQKSFQELQESVLCSGSWLNVPPSLLLRWKHIRWHSQYKVEVTLVLGYPAPWRKGCLKTFHPQLLLPFCYLAPQTQDWAKPQATHHTVTQGDSFQ